MTKSEPARKRAGDYEWLKGKVLDIGCGPIPIKLPPPSTVRGWDLEDGDATLLESIEDKSFDCVTGSHVLEHLFDPELAIRNWARVLKEAGYILATVPLYSCYEKWNDFAHGTNNPAKFNNDHKTSWDLLNLEVAPKNHRHFGYKEIQKLGKQAGLTLVDLRIELDGYKWNRFDDKEFDQTMNGALSQLAIVFQKL